MDAGSSTIEMIPFIKAQNIVVVTNGLTHVEKLLNQGIKTLMIGGQVKETTFATVGASALDTLSRYCFDKAFLGMNGLDLKYGLTTPDEKRGTNKREGHGTSKSIICFTRSFKNRGSLFCTCAN